MEFGEGYSACCVNTSPSRENNITSGHHGENHSEPVIGLQAVSMSFVPKVFIPPKNHKRPISISELFQWFYNSYFYKKKYPLLYAHLNEDKTVRRWMRSEFREMISLGFSILTHYYDVKSGKLGFENAEGEWVNISFKTIAKRLEMPLIRIKRFFKFLKDRGFITITRNHERLKNGKWISKVSEKCIRPAFFIETLGMKAWKKVQNFKNFLLKDSNLRTKYQNDKGQNHFFFKKNAIISPFKKSKKYVFTDQEKSQGIINAEKERQLIDNAMRLHKSNPMRTMLEYLKELKAAPA